MLTPRDSFSRMHIDKLCGVVDARNCDFIVYASNLSIYMFHVIRGCINRLLAYYRSNEALKRKISYYSPHLTQHTARFQCL